MAEFSDGLHTGQEERCDFDFLISSDGGGGGDLQVFHDNCASTREK